MKTWIRNGLQIVWWAALIAGLYLLIDHTFGWKLKDPVYYLTCGLIISVLTLGERQGWIRGTIRDPLRVKAIRDQKAKLEQDRIEAIARAVKHE